MIWSILFFTSCKEKATLFSSLDAAQTGITFSNRITENDTMNILKYEYVYNGGGVGMGDFNNDGLQDLYFSGNQVSNRLYLNKGNLKFEDITEKSGVNGLGRWCSGVSLVDVNNDNLLDIYVSATTKNIAGERANLLYINQGMKDNIPVFKEMGVEYGIADTTYTTNSAFFDYDNDGDLDLYVLVDQIEKHVSLYRNKMRDGSSPNTDRLYRNDFDAKLGHPVFTDVSRQAGILDEGYGLGVNVSDINQDGWKDIYVTNDFITNDLIYINNHDGTFTNMADKYLKHTCNSAMGNDVNDINNDGLQDIIAVDMLPEDNFRKKMFLQPNNYITYQNNEEFHYQYQVVRNVLQINQGKYRGTPAFSETAMLGGIAETDWSWAPMVVDFDQDGLRDIIITNGFPKDITDRDFAVFRQQSSSIASIDYMLELIPSVKIKNYAFKNLGDLHFSNVTEDWGITKPSFSNGAAYGDLDNDGDLDYVVNNINDSASVYRNNLIEQKRENSNYLRIKFKGAGKNTMGYGAIVEIFYDKGKKQVYENTPYRGYLSTVENAAHFGLGNITAVDEVKITWQNGKVQILKAVKSNQVLTVDINNATQNAADIKSESEEISLLQEDTTVVNYIHTEKDFIDFNIQKLLPHKLSQYGPAISVGDVNGDGLDDVYFGGATHLKGKFYLQKQDGTFENKDLMPGITDADKTEEDMGTLFFDADGDGDMDLYIVSGGVEQSAESFAYQDRLYKNEKGVFILVKEAIPEFRASGSCVKAADFDKDGDLDLFVGGRVKPGFYPEPVKSFILQNNSANGKIQFADVTEKIAPELTKIGLVSDALWSDFDNDGLMDLVLAGEWMPITFMKNEKGSFKKWGIEQGVWSKDNSVTPLPALGMWTSLVAGDFDKDGDTDYLAGNVGENTLNRATQNEPIHIYAKDFNNDGNYDAIPSVYFKDEKGQKQEFPFFGRDDMIKQVIQFRKFTDYKTFAISPVSKIFKQEELKDVLKTEINYLKSSYIENLGKGQFRMTPLPVQVQVAPVFGMMAGDFDNDGELDVLLVGNDYGCEIGQGRMDALNGLLLKGDGKGNFQPLTIAASGFYVPGDAKALVSLADAKGRNLCLASQNQGKAKVFVNKQPIKNVKLQSEDAIAYLKYKNNRIRKEELYYGHSFLSQSARRLFVDKDVTEVEIEDFQGKKRKVNLTQ